MKLKKIIFSLAIIILLISCVNSVNAAQVSAKLTPSSATVKKGETFTLTISATCSDGISTFSTSIQYEKDVLELVDGAVVDSSKWFKITSEGDEEDGQNIVVFSSSGNTITSADLYVMTFKVKDTAQTGNTIISAGTITIDSDVASNSLSTIDGESVTINVSEGGSLEEKQATLEGIKIETPPTKTIYNVGEQFSPSGMVIKAVYSDGTEKEVKDYKYSPAGDLLETYTKITITYTENGVTKTATQNITINTSNTDKDGEVQNNTANNVVTNKDNTVTNNSIANTGLEDNIGILFVVIAIMGIASYIQYRKYKNF